MEKILISHLCQTTIFSGEDAILSLAEIVTQMMCKRPMIVTDKFIVSLPWMKDLLKTINNFVMFDEVSQNPKDYEVMQGTRLYIENQCDLVVGIGGGSSMDCAKSISAMIRHDGFIMDYGRSNPNRKYFDKGREKLILIPTTIGTGSEVSPHAVITDTEKQKKSDLQETIFYPDFVLLDSTPVMTLPSKIVKDTGIDALCHAIEVYTSRKAMQYFAPLHEAASLKAIELVATYLRRAVYSGEFDTEAKSMIQWAALLAGFALDLDAGCVHGLAGVLQKQYHQLSHGESVGILLTSVMEYNKLCCSERFAHIARAFGEKVENKSLEEQAKVAVNAVRTLLKDIDFVKLSDFMTNDAEIEEFYKVGAINSCNQNNIRSVTPNEVKEVYLNAFHETYEKN